MKIYTDAEPPKSGTGQRIYRAFKALNFSVHDLHYNANCWGASRADGWGTWACTIGGRLLGEPIDGNYFCGVVPGRGVYLEQPHAPYTVMFIAPAR